MTYIYIHKYIYEYKDMSIPTLWKGIVTLNLPKYKLKTAQTSSNSKCICTYSTFSGLDMAENC